MREFFQTFEHSERRMDQMLHQFADSPEFNVDCTTIRESAKPALTTEQVTAAMSAMLAKANETPDAPVAMAIVDAGGEMLAYLTMDNLRVFSRRHARRKAYTSAIIGRDSGEHAAGLAAQGRGIADMGDPGFTYGQGGLVIMKDGVILGGIGVGGYPSGQADEDLSRVGLNAMNL